MQIECCRISFDLFLDPRPSTFRHTVEIWNQINFYIQQNVSATQWLLANRPWSFWAQKIGGFHRPLFGYRKSIPAFLAIVEFQIMCHGVTSLHELWTPLLGRSCCANRHLRCQCLGCGDWDRLDGNFQAQSVTNRNKIIQPSWSIFIFQFQPYFVVLTCPNHI